MHSYKKNVTNAQYCNLPCFPMKNVCSTFVHVFSIHVSSNNSTLLFQVTLDQMFLDDRPWYEDFLPRGCSTILLSKCSVGHNVSMIMSSTSPWYQLKSDSRTLYTYGIVFVELDSIAIPVSITGIQVVREDANFSLISGSLATDIADGNQYGALRQSGCWEFDITPRDVHDFLSSNSSLATYFNMLEHILPDWLSFTPDGDVIFGVNDLQTEFTTGADIQQGECRGAPLHPDHTYTVLKLRNSFSMSLYGQDIKLPKPANNKKFCIVIDICRDLGGSVFVVLPENSRDILDRFEMTKSLIDKFGLHIRPVGFGVSLAKHVYVHAQTTELQMWNGDQLFLYSYVTIF